MAIIKGKNVRIYVEVDGQFADITKDTNSFAFDATDSVWYANRTVWQKIQNALRFIFKRSA